MSHIVTIKAQFRDAQAVGAACARLNIAAPVQGTHDVFGTKCEGLAVRLPRWYYPIVIDTRTGTAHYDNYGGAWGKDGELDRFRQAYAIEKTKREATRKGYRCTEQPQPDGSVKLTVNLP